MSRTVFRSLTSIDVPDVKYGYRSLEWKLYWSSMVAVDSKGRFWSIKDDGSRLYLEFEKTIQATMSVDDVRKSYDKHLSRRNFLRKWVGEPK